MGGGARVWAAGQPSEKNRQRQSVTAHQKQLRAFFIRTYACGDSCDLLRADQSDGFECCDRCCGRMADYMYIRNTKGGEHA